MCAKIKCRDILFPLANIGTNTSISKVWIADELEAPTGSQRLNGMTGLGSLLTGIVTRMPVTVWPGPCPGPLVTKLPPFEPEFAAGAGPRVRDAQPRGHSLNARDCPASQRTQIVTLTHESLEPIASPSLIRWVPVRAFF